MFFTHYNKRFYPQIHASVDLVLEEDDRERTFSIVDEKHLKLSLDMSLREWRKNSNMGASFRQQVAGDLFHIIKRQLNHPQSPFQVMSKHFSLLFK